MAQVELQEFKTLDGKPVLTEAAKRDGAGNLLSTKYVSVDTDQTITGSKTFTSGISVPSTGGVTVSYDVAYTSLQPEGVYIENRNAIDDFTGYGKTGIYGRIDNTTFNLVFPKAEGTLALISDIPTNHVTTDTYQEITGSKTFSGSVSFVDNITISRGGTLGYTAYSANSINRVDGSLVANIQLPSSGGTLALISDIPTNISSLTNDAGYTTNTGTVTSVTIKAGTGLVSSSTSAITGAGTRTISISSAYKLPTLIEWTSVSHPGDKKVIVQHVGDYLNSVTGGRFRVAYYSNTSAELQYSDWLYPTGSGSGTTSSATIYCSIFKIEPEGSSSSVTLPSGCLKGATNNTLYTGGASLSKNTWYLPCSLANVWANSSMDRLTTVN